MRWSLRATAAAAAVVAGLAPAHALMIAMKPPAQRAITAEVVVAGKVTAVGQDEVEALAPFAGATNKVKYKVATVKVETGLVGADKLKEVKVGFVLPPKADPKAPPGGIRPPRGPRQALELKEGQEMLFFLAKHPTADFYIIPGMSPPVDLKDEQGKKELEAVKKVTAVLADPAKALKADKAEARAEAAAIMVTKYRAYPDAGGEVDQVAIAADESKTILKALLEGDWSSQAVRPGPFGGNPNPLQAFYALGLNQKDGWVQPIIAPSPPGAPQPDYGLIMKDAFAKWREGAGKDYVIKKIVPKKPAGK